MVFIFDRLCLLIMIVKILLTVSLFLTEIIFKENFPFEIEKKNEI